MLRSAPRPLVIAALLALPACGGSERRDLQADTPSVRSAASAPRGAGIAGGAVRDTRGAGTTGERAPESAPGMESTLTAPSVAGSGGAGAGSSAAPAPESAPDADRILRRVEEAYDQVRSLQADFVQELHVPLLGTRQRSTGKIYQRSPDRFLMKFSDPAGDLIVSDGEHFWMYYPSSDAKQVMRTSVAAGSEQVDLHRQFLSDPVARYAGTLTGTERVDGHAVHVLTLVPRRPSPYRQLRIWVDTDDYTVRRFEMTEENGSMRRIELRNLRKNIALPDALFEFTPPRGTQIFEQ